MHAASRVNKQPGPSFRLWYHAPTGTPAAVNNRSASVEGESDNGSQVVKTTWRSCEKA